MNEANYRGISCYFHPKEEVVGVCHLCLNERLLILAAKQGVNSNSSKLLGSKLKYSYYKRSNSFFDDNSFQINKPKSFISFPKIFGIGSFFVNSRDKITHRRRRRRKSNRDSFDAVDYDDATSTSFEEDESFISIKFGDNGVASWDKTSSTVSKAPIEDCRLPWSGQTSVKDKGSGGNHSQKSVVEHPKPRPPSLRWRKRIGQLFQVMRWKKSSKASVGGGSGGGGNNKVVWNNKSWVKDSKDDEDQ